ncbi:MAG: peptidoglycan DD-metalloendopeptidase family protein [Bacteroidetes bacterium]|nr:peptidoglycan DD-metalloendopeptidase family protein [Bacteroidota bacterium]
MIKKIFYTLICLLFATAAFAQKKQSLSREQLETQRQSILSEIKRTQSELTTLRQDKKATLAQLQTLQAKLDARHKLISNINNEISLIETNINLANNDVHILKTKLDTLKKQYAEMVRYTYKNRTSSDLIVFLFSSSSFNDAIRRLNYVKQYRGYRADQAVKITSASKQLTNKITVLNMEKQKKDYVLIAQQNQNKILESETQEKDKVVTELKGKEKELLYELAKNKKAADDLNKAISAAIKYEIDQARKRAMDEKLQQDRLRKQKEEQDRRVLADKRAKEQEATEKARREEAARKLAIEKKAQEQKEQQALLEKQKREELERKLALEQREREAKEKALALEKKKREEDERKASQMAEANRIQKEKELAIEKQKQEERSRVLALEKQKQEERERKLTLDKQRQEEEQRRLAEEKRRQEREQERLASKTPYNNPRYVPNAEKPKYGEVALNTGSSEEYTPAYRGPKKDAERTESPSTNNTVAKSNVKSFSNDDYKFSLTPLEREISNNFELSKGRLPWPVEKGYIIERFGKNKHPLFNIYTENYGIDIKTSRAASARAIFAGEVSSIISIPGTGTTVIINHGSFFTVYAKLSSVSVRKGSRVALKQSIGTVMTDDEGNTQINFQVWRIGANGSSFKLNPEQWIAQ